MSWARVLHRLWWKCNNNSFLHGLSPAILSNFVSGNRNYPKKICGFVYCEDSVHMSVISTCGLYEWRLYLSAGGEVLAGEGQVRLHCLAILTTSWRCCACSVDQSWQTSDWRAWTYNAGDIVKFVMANETPSNCKSANHRVTTCLENREMSGIWQLC